MQNYHKYLSISEADKKWGLYLVTAGQGTIEKGTSYPVGNHPREYLFNWNRGRILNGLYIVYIARGKGIFESENMPATAIGEGTCFMLLPKVWHRYQPDPAHGWQEYWIGLRGRILGDWIREQCIPDDKALYHTGVNNQLESLFLSILGSVKSNSPGQRQLITGMALQVLGLILGIDKNVAPRTIEQKIGWARTFIDENLEQAIYGEHLAKELAISYSLFRKRFKSVTGWSPAHYQLHKRLEKARELLSTTHLPIEEIALLMGFDSVYYFSRAFKAKSGLSPTVFRKKYFFH
ncbi:AraC-like DNA-binding protein [Anseongella ginsenosidimutans]|uniref:AraC-like DNA-binding protein n=1 Tax=Anseongella ginsenosidimutans TaxID=496056 RepID=A0A4R3KWG0_9SPHI|nr:AraC family transcriptional regulator [Anseongella ginsenosidimutans]QEC51355.1 helix-turn-helix domain-containing protein [Anseongella ginsenosidimutans]TCS89945.1 AraC-like DNA-binding protein [Anseongella ginsenosidimutans]